MNDEPNPMSKQMYLEREFHRVARDRETYRVLAWLWGAAAFIGWSALIAVAFKAGIIGT